MFRDGCLEASRLAAEHDPPKRNAVRKKPLGPSVQAFVVMLRFLHRREAMCSTPARDGSRTQRIAHQPGDKYDDYHENDRERCAHRANATTDSARILAVLMGLSMDVAIRVGIRLAIVEDQR